MVSQVAVSVAVHGCVVAVCYIRFGQFNAFLLLFQIEESEGISATNVTRGTMELTG